MRISGWNSCSQGISSLHGLAPGGPEVDEALDVPLYSRERDLLAIEVGQGEGWGGLFPEAWERRRWRSSPCVEALPGTSVIWLAAFSWACCILSRRSRAVVYTRPDEEAYS